ncbi:MAG TPA: UbiA family prenyltransferase [Candidatus Limnocylindrales bacterium]|nr:UbiA family prenyltransferase [Candidatus Limnocylindrales bacterium]
MKVDLVRFVAASRLVHPFPSVLDGVVVALIALVAGGGVLLSVVLGASMTCLQFAIGALNDVVDAPSDAGRKPGKPIPAGLVTVRQAKVVAALAAGLGLLLSLVGGPWLLAVAAVSLATGVVYDLWAKGTTMSWLPLAVGIPLLPLYGWFGATGSVPGMFLVLLPAAANAGTALAIANALVDLERDRDAGDRSIALALGPERASRLVLLLHGVVAVLAVATAAAVGAPTGWVVAVLAASLAPLGGAVLGLLAATRSGHALREIAWEVQAVGTGLLAVAWLGALSASAGLTGA